MMDTRIDFEDITTVFCCANNERVPDLYAAAFNVMMNTRNGEFIILMNEPSTEKSQERFDMLFALANHTGNKFSLCEFEPTWSKAQMIETVLFNTNRRWHLNVDDDFMIPFGTLNLLSQARHRTDASMFIYGLFDVINYRNYEDWSDTQLKEEDLFEFIAENGMRCLNNHLCADIPKDLKLYKIPGQSTGSYMVNVEKLSFLQPDIQKVLKEWPKGKRGYDDFLCRYAAECGPMYWIYGSNSFHTDLTRHHVDGKIWTQDVFRDDNMLGGETKGRIPVKEVGEKSIKRGERPDDAPAIPEIKV